MAFDDFGKYVEIMQQRQVSHLQRVEREELKKRCSLLKRAKFLSKTKQKKLRAAAMTKSLKRWLKNG